MANECSKINPDCMMKNNIKCPAFDAGRNCWEFDWMPMFQSMPQQEREQARQFMAKKCPECAAFREPMKKMIERILSLQKITPRRQRPCEGGKEQMAFYVSEGLINRYHNFS